MDSVIARPIGIALRSSFFKNGTNDAIIDRTLSANADEKKHHKIILSKLHVGAGVTGKLVIIVVLLCVNFQ